MTPTYIKQTESGAFEYGFIEVNANRRQDRLIRIGECEFYTQATLTLLKLKEAKGEKE
jgi:hypothetical protein